MFFIFVLACIDIHAIKNITEYCDIYSIFEFNTFSYDDLVEESIFKIWCFINGTLIAILFFPKGKKWLTFVSRLLGCTIFFFTLVDLFCIYEFSTRLDLTKFLDFTGNTNGDSFYFIVNYLSFPQVQICLILFAGLILLSIKFKNSFKVSINISLAIACFLALFMCGIAQNNSKIAHWMFTSTESQSYSNDYPYKDYSNSIDTYQGLNSRKNIIIVVVESLSSYMSKHFYPVHGLGYTPFLDSLAENTIEFRNYSCTAFNSSENMYSLISGYPYIHNNVTDEKPSNSNSPEEEKLSQYRRSGSAYFKHNFIDVFRTTGYKVKIFHGGDLVYGMDSLVSGLSPEIENIDGNNPVYDKEEKFVFNSVTDEVLYKNVLRNAESDTINHSNYLYIVRTVTSHNPYIDPVTKTNSIELTIRYADNALKHLVEHLTENNFFDNGILVVLGDHRAMLPPNIFENKDMDIARVPMLIKRQKEPEHLVILNNLSHQSLGNILEYLALDKAYRLPHQVNPLVDRTQNETVLYRSFTPSNELIVIKDNNSCKFVLDGDNSEFRNCNNTKILQEEENIKSFVYYLQNGCR